MQILIRPAIEQDAEAILEIHRQAIEDQCFVQNINEFTTTVEQKLKAIIKTRESSNSILLVAELDKQVVGWLSLSGYELEKLRHVAMLGMAVHRQFRRRGVGKTLTRYAIEWAKTNETLRRIGLAVFSTNVSAVQLYKSVGFEIEGIEKNEIRFSDGKFSDQILMGLTW
jgi:ribosomal protein S18 acetylase RimI-like enzyme